MCPELNAPAGKVLPPVEFCTAIADTKTTPSVLLNSDDPLITRVLNSGYCESYTVRFSPAENVEVSKFTPEELYVTNRVFKSGDLDSKPSVVFTI